MRINTNMAALNAWRSMSSNQTNLQRSLEKLSSGYRINRASDDAAGLAVSETMRAQIRGMNQAVRNAQDGIGLTQTAEGGAGVIHDMLQRMRELANRAANGTLQPTDRTALDTEFQDLLAEIDNTASRTKFNGTTLLTGGLGSSVGGLGASITTDNGIASITANGAAVGVGYALVVDTTANTVKITSPTAVSETVNYTTEPTGLNTKTLNFSTLGFQVVINASLADINATNTFTVTGGSGTLQVGANASETVQVSIGDLRASGANLGLTGKDLTSQSTATTALSQLDTAINYVSQQRANLGAFQNRLESTVTNLQTGSENLTAAESRIRDVDMAAEMATFTKYQVLSQASTAMLAQANQLGQGILSLLR